jgi:hypothetical protein
MRSSRAVRPAPTLRRLLGERHAGVDFLGRGHRLEGFDIEVFCLLHEGIGVEQRNHPM